MWFRTEEEENNALFVVSDFYISKHSQHTVIDHRPCKYVINLYTDDIVDGIIPSVYHFACGALSNIDWVYEFGWSVKEIGSPLTFANMKTHFSGVPSLAEICMSSIEKDKNYIRYSKNHKDHVTNVMTCVESVAVIAICGKIIGGDLLIDIMKYELDEDNGNALYSRAKSIVCKYFNEFLDKGDDNQDPR